AEVAATPFPADRGLRGQRATRCDRGLRTGRSGALRCRADRPLRNRVSSSGGGTAGGRGSAHCITTRTSRGSLRRLPLPAPGGRGTRHLDRHDREMNRVRFWSALLAAFAFCTVPAGAQVQTDRTAALDYL